MADLNIRQIIKTIPVKNRVVDAPVKIVFDREEVVWEPGEVKHLPFEFATWFIAKSAYLIDTTSSKRYYKLVHVGIGQDESDLTLVELPTEADGIIDWSTKQYAHPVTGQPFRRVAMPVNGVPVPPERKDAEHEAKQLAHKALVEAGVEKIAEATQGMSEQDMADELRAMAAPTPPRFSGGAVEGA